MTAESIQIANELDQLPEWAREQMRDSFLRLLHSFETTVEQQRTPASKSMPGRRFRRHTKTTKKGDIIVLAHHRKRLGGTA